MQVGSDVEASAGSLDSRNILWTQVMTAWPCPLHVCLTDCPSGPSFCPGFLSACNILWIQVTA